MSKMKKVIAIFGMPRSGTSFLGQILDSCSNVAYRLEPIFSYKLKNIVDENSTKEEFLSFFEKAYNSDEDEFMNQVEKRKKGHYPTFKKDEKIYLAFKTTRFHNILPTLMKYFNEEELKVISLVRHPAGAIYSWINHPNEFPVNCDYKTEWRSGNCRKTEKEEFWGFDDWKKVMSQHIELEMKYNNFRIFQYENIVRNIELETQEIFNFAGIPYTDQTREFLLESQSKNIDDPYAVYKNKDVISKWRKNLDIEIQTEIIKDIEISSLKKFLVD
ncbi:MAG: sulfotransferase [gamma proteobacterium symbiont of Lucinoma myriamae]|nr:sulfotransferase [gamma proteobacterium symbiont of Lucinoma myriamae]MCU7820027.1 sulfotransferase [gamma proteobacterium symbiont of Lucinoma myriamae]MCU7831392.1 sulfotransferase [gamma proteobacterium symbiont of Lucinoma myriamae]